MLEHRDLSKRIIGWAIDVPVAKPGVDCWSRFYAACLALELEQAGIPLLRQVSDRVFYKAKQLSLDLRIDLLVADIVTLEIKAVSALLHPPLYVAACSAGNDILPSSKESGEPRPSFW